MLRLLALAAHFSPLNPGPYDPAVLDLINAYFEPKQRPQAPSAPSTESSAAADSPALKAA